MLKNFTIDFVNLDSLEPRIYYTGGRGFQLNIDFPQPVDLPVSVKRQSIRDFLMHLKKKYTLTTLDEHCIGNSVSCMRRMPGSQYLDINKHTNLLEENVLKYQWMI